MEELKNTLQLTLEKYKNEYKAICEPLSDLVSRKNNASKFDEINEKMISEIIDKSNAFIVINPDAEKNKVIEVSQMYIKDFQKQLINPFS